MAAAANGKSVELFKDMLPNMRRAGVLGHATNPVYAKAMLDEVLRAGAPTGTEIQPVVMVSGPDELESAFATFVKEKADVVVVQGSLAIKPVTDAAIDFSVASSFDPARICGHRRPHVLRRRRPLVGSARHQACTEDFAGQATERLADRATR
jgi:hypothetical protein